MLLRTPTLISSEVGHGKTKPSRWLERSPKMMNLHECHCLRKLSKYENMKNNKNISAGVQQTPHPPGPPPTPLPLPTRPPLSVSTGLMPMWKRAMRSRLYRGEYFCY